jgi:hypothetical protein
MSDVTIYALVDPRDSMIRYVGQTVNTAVRYASFATATNADLQDWFDDLRRNGLKPHIHVLETVSFADMYTRERYHIHRLVNEGHVLLNKINNPAFKRERTSEPTVKATFSFPESTSKRLDELAKREHRKVSAQLVKMLEEELDRAERKKGWK